MSYRELKQFVEIIRTLGYDKPIGMDSFDSPNFGLMANLVQWLAQLTDPELYVASDISNERGRVEFVRSIVQQIAIKSGIRLNSRRLYASDRFAVRELLKIAAPIYRGIVTLGNAQPKQTTAAKGIPSSAKKISQLSSSVPKHSAQLYDSLEKELMIYDSRTRVLNTLPPLDQMENEVTTAVDNAVARLDTLTRELDKLNSDEDSLRSKVRLRKTDLDRQSKRLVSVRNIRPAFMDEYEALERELQELFKIYFQHYRNVDFYESEIQKQTEALNEIREMSQREITKIKKEKAKQITKEIAGSYKIEDRNPITDMISDNDSGIGFGNPDTDDQF